jgi:hypothetical protein
MINIMTNIKDIFTKDYFYWKSVVVLKNIYYYYSVLLVFSLLFIYHIYNTLKYKMELLDLGSMEIIIGSLVNQDVRQLYYPVFNIDLTYTLIILFISILLKL